MLKTMRREKKWNGTASCGYKKEGMKGLSAGMFMAVKTERDVLMPNVDHDNISGDPRNCAVVQKGDTEMVFTHMCGHVGLGLTGANIEMIQK